MMRGLICSLAVAGIAGLGFAGVVHPVPLLVWNVSASLPIGLYRVVPGMPQRGDPVLVSPPRDAEILAEARGYLPVGVPLVKRLAAGAGDRVCASASIVVINSRQVAHQRAADRIGRPLPRWTGCRLLDGTEIFLLTDATDSFDSRYFGPVPAANMIGRLVPLWTE